MHALRDVLLQHDKSPLHLVRDQLRLLIRHCRAWRAAAQLLLLEPSGLRVLLPVLVDVELGREEPALDLGLSPRRRHDLQVAAHVIRWPILDVEAPEGRHKAARRRLLRQHQLPKREAPLCLGFRVKLRVRAAHHRDEEIEQHDRAQQDPQQQRDPHDADEEPRRWVEIPPGIW